MKKEMVGKKKCQKCKRWRDVGDGGDFYKRKDSPDGFAYICKICERKRLKKYRKTKRGKEVIGRASARYFQTEKGKATKERHREKLRVSKR